jgi:hypothetical protein
MKVAYLKLVTWYVLTISVLCGRENNKVYSRGRWDIQTHKQIVVIRFSWQQLPTRPKCRDTLWFEIADGNGEIVYQTDIVTIQSQIKFLVRRNLFDPDRIYKAEIFSDVCDKSYAVYNLPPLQDIMAKHQ